MGSTWVRAAALTQGASLLHEAKEAIEKKRPPRGVLFVAAARTSLSTDEFTQRVEGGGGRQECPLYTVLETILFCQGNVEIIHIY